jgi:hypothetical protein
MQTGLSQRRDNPIRPGEVPEEMRRLMVAGAGDRVQRNNA